MLDISGAIKRLFNRSEENSEAIKILFRKNREVSEFAFELAKNTDDELLFNRLINWMKIHPALVIQAVPKQSITIPPLKWSNGQVLFDAAVDKLFYPSGRPIIDGYDDGSSKFNVDEIGIIQDAPGTTPENCVLVLQNISGHLQAVWVNPGSFTSWFNDSAGNPAYNKYILVGQGAAALWTQQTVHSIYNVDQVNQSNPSIAWALAPYGNDAGVYLILITFCVVSGSSGVASLSVLGNDELGRVYSHSLETALTMTEGSYNYQYSVTIPANTSPVLQIDVPTIGTARYNIHTRFCLVC